ncbi:hypothetical protein ABZU94_08670 [Streptomyces mirabilis]|uniref:hypothetical protein n=1 Tax=Streptomyces sp. NPDC005388 TaxID=3156717 RepID=UPI0033AE1E05
MNGEKAGGTAGRALSGLLGAGLLGLGTRRASGLARVDRLLTVPAAVAGAQRRAWLAVTALGSRPVAYTAVTARCLLDADSTDRWRPLGPRCRVAPSTAPGRRPPNASPRPTGRASRPGTPRLP